MKYNYPTCKYTQNVSFLSFGDFKVKNTLFFRYNPKNKEFELKNRQEWYTLEGIKEGVNISTIWKGIKPNKKTILEYIGYNNEYSKYKISEYNIKEN